MPDTAVPKTIYDSWARILHWVMAVAMIGLLAVGLYMDGLPDEHPAKWPLYGLHKSIGTGMIILIMLRILWRAGHKPPAELMTQAAWERFLAKLVHVLLYVGMVVMPFSGYFMSVAGGHPVDFFGLFPIPPVIEEDPALAKTMRLLHGAAGQMVIIAIALHFLGAMKHFILDKDNTLYRMAPIGIFKHKPL